MFFVVVDIFKYSQKVMQFILTSKYENINKKLTLKKSIKIRIIKIPSNFKEPSASSNEIALFINHAPSSSNNSVSRVNSLTHEPRLNSLSRAEDASIRIRGSITTATGSDNNLSVL